MRSRSVPHVDAVGDQRDSERETTTSDRRDADAAPGSERIEPAKEGDTKPNEGAEPEKSASRTRVYRVQSGKFNTREEAQKAQLELAKSGKGGFIVPAGDGFRLQLGVFRSRENAEKAAETARTQNIMARRAPRREERR